MSDSTPLLQVALNTATALRQAATDWEAHLRSALQSDRDKDADGRAGALFNARRAARIIDRLRHNGDTRTSELRTALRNTTILAIVANTDAATETEKAV